MSTAGPVSTAENAPLLGSNSKLPSYDAQAVNADASPDADEADEALLQKPEPTPWTPLSIAFYGLLAGFVLFFVAIVIKGFVDEKDPKEPDVCLSFAGCELEQGC